MTKLIIFFSFVLTIGACSWSYPIWIQRSIGAEDLYRFYQGRKAGYINRSGQVVISPRFDMKSNFGAEFHDGLLAVGEPATQYVDRTGREVIDRGLEWGRPFSEGLAAAQRKNDSLWGFINTRGEFAIGPKFDFRLGQYSSFFVDGVAHMSLNGKYGFIDHRGEFVIPPKFLFVAPFSEGLARVVIEGPCAYIADGPCPELHYLGGAKDFKNKCRFSFVT